MENSTFRNRAKQNLNNQWLNSAIATLIVSLINGVANSLSFLVYGPLRYGYIKYLCTQAREGRANFKLIFDGFNRYATTLAAGILKICIICVGIFLLIVPGVIAALGLSMTFYIMVDEPDISPVKALRKSWEMTNGYKAELFVFYIEFIGWWIVSVLTCGIGMFFLTPYIQTAQIYFYEELKKRYYNTPPQDFHL